MVRTPAFPILDMARISRLINCLFSLSRAYNCLISLVYCGAIKYLPEVVRSDRTPSIRDERKHLGFKSWSAVPRVCIAYIALALSSFVRNQSGWMIPCRYGSIGSKNPLMFVDLVAFQHMHKVAYELSTQERVLWTSTVRLMIL